LSAHDHAHDHDHAPQSSRRLSWALLLTLSFAGVEAVGGWLSGSLALLGDAGHMLTDATSLGLAALAARVAQRPATERHSYGLGRVEVLAALINALFMLGLVAAITSVMARFDVNITSLKAAFRGGDDPHRNTMIYEVDVPIAVDREAYLAALQKEARSLGLELSVQHRDIFEAIHRI